MDANKNIIDLDALAPEQATRTVKLGGNTFELQPPKTINVLRLGSLAKKMQILDELPTDQQDKLVDDLTAEIKLCVPEAASVELKTAQLLKLVEILSDMAMPDLTPALETNGVTAETPKAQ
jgi:hypothetical protein